MVKFTDEELKDLKKKGLSNRECARQLDVNESSIRSRLKYWARQGWTPSADITHLVPEGFRIKGASIYCDAEGIPVKQWVKTIAEDNKETQIDASKEAFKEFAETLPRLVPQTVMNEHEIDSNLMAIYPLGDPHVGMMAWNEETGGGNWDLQVAEDTLTWIFHRVVLAAPRCNKGVILNLGDFFHYDNQEGVTARSKNILDRDGRYAKMVRVGIRIIRQMIATALEHHETVEVINVIGNHDETGALFLSICLDNIYENDPRVTINTSPSVFHFIRFGKVFIGAHHGHTCKKEKLPGVMAAKKASDWGETEHRYWLTGHIHHDSVKEFPGCKVESFRTIAAPDAYASSGGWLSGRDQKVIVYHKEYGEVARSTVNISQYMQNPQESV